ncbi:50S ribosomal protein L24 [Candidatus Nomurabacteria bacterium]|nr:50S ribosomal protein L24 [Candidatus Nomurabacteria bacterium]
MNIKKGDNIIVISGKDKGKIGQVVKAMPKDSKIIVPGINMRKRHEKPRKSGQKGQIVEKPVPIHVSNVQIVAPGTNKGTRVGRKLVDGKNLRYAKKGGDILDK